MTYFAEWRLTTVPIATPLFSHKKTHGNFQSAAIFAASNSCNQTSVAEMSAQHRQVCKLILYLALVCRAITVRSDGHPTGALFLATQSQAGADRHPRANDSVPSAQRSAK
jgi:hypothetical protein